MLRIECIPNISEGRDATLIDALAEEIRRVPGVAFFDIHTDPDHHRSVFTFAGSPESVGDAAVVLARSAAEQVVLTAHDGIHPRMGAVDVIPFVPLGQTPMQSCIELAQSTAERIADELSIPTFLYDAASPDGHTLPQVRSGGFERHRTHGFPVAPDYGPDAPHPQAGAIAVGARMPLIAWNVFLSTPDLKIAKKIAREIRESSGGLPGIRALGLYLEHYGTTQVSMNVVDYRKTSVQATFDAINQRAEELGTHITHSELVGLIPRGALPLNGPESILLQDFSDSRILENRLG